MAYTTTELLASLKRRALIPTSQSTYAVADFLALADDEIQSRVVPLVLSAREEYYDYDSDSTLSASTTTYAIPSRAVGGKLRNVAVLDSAGAALYNPPRIQPEQLPLVSSVATCFYVKGNSIVFPNAPTQGSTLRLTHYIRPNRLVATSAAARITAINTGTKVLTLSSSIPSTFTTSVTYDLIQAQPGFSHLGIDLAVSAASGTSMTFSATLPTNLVVGDWVALAQESPIPQIPADLHPLLAQGVACRVLEGLGDREGLEAATAELTRMEKSALLLVDDRTEGSPQRVVNRNSVFWPVNSGRSW